MASFLWKGIRLERRLGGAWFLYLLSVFSVLTGVVYLVLETLLAELTQDQSYSMQCAVGFSGILRNLNCNVYNGYLYIFLFFLFRGVLFALKVLSNHYHPGGVTYVMGLPVSNRYASWVELVLIHITAPGWVSWVKLDLAFAKCRHQDKQFRWVHLPCLSASPGPRWLVTCQVLWWVCSTLLDHWRPLWRHVQVCISKQFKKQSWNSV